MGRKDRVKSIAKKSYLEIDIRRKQSSKNNTINMKNRSALLKVSMLCQRPVLIMRLSHSMLDQLVRYNLGQILVEICEIWQKVLVRELAKSAYFRSASSESDIKWFYVEGLVTRLPFDTLTCFKSLTIWPKSIWKIYRKIYRFMNYIYKSLLQFCLWCEIPQKL